MNKKRVKSMSSGNMVSKLLLLVGVLAFGALVYLAGVRIGSNNQAIKDGQKFVYQIGDVLGISSNEEDVTVDFSKQIQNGSPLIFGGSHAPKLEHQDAWDKVAASGVTMIRRDIAINWELPKNITLADYIANKNGVQDPANWDQTKVKEAQDYYKKAKDEGMKVIAIASFNPRWLTYNNTDFGVPKDWNVYEDLVAKAYRLHRPYIDYVEIWNEPNYPVFLNPAGSPYTREEAYYLMFVHASAAIRRVDAEINDGRRTPLGAPVTSEPSAAKVLEKILADPNAKANLDFVSYHNYNHVPEPSDGDYQALLAKYNTKLPIFITEWSSTPNIKERSPLVLTDEGIPYTASKLIWFMKMGVQGANYFSLMPLVPNSAYGNEGMLGFYEWSNNQANLLPLAKTWELMSNTLALGKGPSKVYSTQGSMTNSVGWANVNGVKGVVFANDSNSAKTINLSLKNVSNARNIKVNAYVASRDYNGKNSEGQIIAANKDNQSKVKVVIPAMSTVGLTIEDQGWFEGLNLF